MSLNQKITLFVSSLFLLFIFSKAICKNQKNPYSQHDSLNYSNLISSNKLNYTTFTKPLLDSIITNENKLDSLGIQRAYRFGVELINDKFDINSFMKEELENGDYLFRYKIIAIDALSINIIFNEFTIPDGGYFFTYSPDYKFVDGPWYNNKGMERN